MAYAGNESDDWPNLVSGTATPYLVNFQKFAQLDSLGSISVYAHDLVCSGLDLLKNKDGVSVVTKITIFPTPGKSKILRSSGNVSDEGSASFPFHRQVAELNMSTADMRGRAYAQGYSPMLSIEVSINNKTYNGHGELYLPGIFTLLDDDILTLPISLSSESPGFEQASFLVDIRCNPAGKIVKKRKPQAVNLWVHGLSNKVPRAGSLHVSLSCCDESGRDAQQLQDVKINKKATEFENFFQLTSIWPEGDVLTIRILDDQESEVGRVLIPVPAIMNSSVHDKMAHRVWVVNGKDVFAQDCYLICAAESVDTDNVETDIGIKKALIEDQSYGPENNDDELHVTSAVGHDGAPEPLNSLGGRLLGCVQGFTCEDSNVISGRHRYITEVCLRPTEGSAQAPWQEQTQACAPHATSTRHGVEWGKSFELPIAYALQQRYSLHLTVQLFEESSKGGKKRCLGEACFDIVSLVSVRDNEIMTFFLPVFTPDSAKLIPSARKEIGKFVISVQFTSEQIFAPAVRVQAGTLNSTANPLGTTKTFGATNFSALSDTRGSRTPGKSPNGRSVATAVGGYAGTMASINGNKRKGPPMASGVAGKASHSEVANASQSFWRALMENELKEAPVNVYIQFNPISEAANIQSRFGDSLTLVVDSMQESFDTKLLFDDFEDTLRAEEDATFKIMTQARETAIALNVCLGRAGNACCECWIVLSKASLVMGLPIQLDLPLRDSHGLRVAILRLGSHTSTPELAVTRSEDSLRVTFLEGHVSDPLWANPLELYFECTLVAHRDYKGDLSRVHQGRTNWISGQGRKSREVDIDKMQCTVDLPVDATPEQYMKRVPTGAPTWSLTIVGRDASRPGAPALVTGNVNLSWTLLTNDKTVQEHFMLRHASTGRSLPVSAQIEKIKKGSGGLDAGSNGYEGIGSALIWMHGAQFPRENAPARIDSAEISVRWSFGNELSGQPFNENGDEEGNNDGVSSAMFARVESMAQTRGGEKPLVASVPLPGGYADLKLSVSCGDGMYSTLLPALAAVSKPDAINMLDFPKFNVILSKDGAKPVRGDPGSCPRLHFSMIYVPYVVGKLVFSIQDVRLEMNPGAWVLQPGNKKAALRFTMGTLANKFTSQFTIKEVFNAAPPGKSSGKNKSSTASLFGAQTDMQKSSSKFRKNMAKTSGAASSGVGIMPKPEIIEIPMNTFDLMNCPGSDGLEEPLDLHFALIDLAGLPSNDSSTSAQMSYVRAVGTVPTASLYYQAMRDAIAQPPTSFNTATRGGCSPDVSVTLPLRHPGSGEVIGTVYGSLKFCMFGGAQDVIEDIAEHIKAAGNVCMSNADCGAELGLKQAYAAADRDNSGGISKTELISVFMAIKADAKKGKTSSVGLDENAIRALIALMNVLDGDDTNNDENILEVSNDQFKAYLEEFFTRLDLDGDGTVSWWEWRQVLYAASLIRNKIAVKFMDHLDPLIVSYLAAHHGLESIRLSDPDSNIATATADLNMFRNISWGDGKKKSESDRLLDELRKRNQELEDALRSAGQGNDAEANARIRIAREEADNAKRQLDAERARWHRLQSEIDGLAGSVQALGRSDLEEENRKARERLAEQTVQSKERIALAHWQRKKKSHAINVIRRGLLRWINKHRKKKLTENDIDGLMGSIICNAAAVRIQKMHRGNLGRAKAKRHWWAIAVIQEFCRTRKERRARRSEFADLVAKMAAASRKIQSAYRIAQMKRMNKQNMRKLKLTEGERRAELMAELTKRAALIRSATKIQTSFRARLAWKELMARLTGKMVDVVDVIPAERPVLTDAIRHWVRVGTDKKGAPRQGFVNDVDVQRKELCVVFEDSSNEKIETVSFDNPDIIWFEETGALVERDGIPKRMNQTNMYDIWLQATSKPLLREAKHYWVRVNNNPELKLPASLRSVERQYFYGYVTSFNEKTKSVGVFFDDFNTVVQVSYDTSSSDLRWYHELLEPDAKKILEELDGKDVEEALPVYADVGNDDDEVWLQETEKPQFSMAMNHWVQAVSIPSVAPNKSLYGLVVGVDDDKKLLHVYFDDLRGEKVVPFHTSKLRWYDAISPKKAGDILRMLDCRSADSPYSPKKSSKKTSQKEKDTQSSALYDFQQEVSRPEIDEATSGYYVRIMGNDSGNTVEGKVVAVDESKAKKTMKIQAIVNGVLTDEFHYNVPYMYRDQNRIKWYRMSQ